MFSVPEPGEPLGAVGPTKSWLVTTRLALGPVTFTVPIPDGKGLLIVAPPSVPPIPKAFNVSEPAVLMLSMPVPPLTPTIRLAPSGAKGEGGGIVAVWLRTTCACAGAAANPLNTKLAANTIEIT